jgi:hypothetical protein
MKICKKCLLSAHYPRISFDEKGICNFCNEIEAEKERILDYSRNEELFREKFDRVRGKYKYDVLIGISGGKDGAYVAYQLKNKFKLRVLAYTNDLGLITGCARENIHKLVKKLGVDHVFYKPREPLVRKMFRNAVLLYGHPCFACTSAHFLVGTRLALEYKVPIRAHGRSPYQILKDFSRGNIDFVRLNLDNNLLAYDAKRNRVVLEKSLGQIWGFFLNKLVGRARRQEFYREIFPRKLSREITQTSEVPEFLAYFLSEPYDEKAMFALLERECGMVFPTSSKLLSHFDCVIHDASNYLLNKVNGFSVLEQELCAMVRLGALSREGALQRLRAESCFFAEPADSLKTLKKMCGIERIPTGSIILNAKIITKLSRKLKSLFKR